MAAAADAKGDAYESALNAWKKTRVERLTAENGWLTLCGLWFLEDGAATVGSAANSKIRVPDACPAAVGTLTFAKATGKLSFAPAPGAVVTVAGVPAADAKAALQDLRHDKAKGGGSALEIANAAGGGADVTLYLIERSGQVAVRGKYKHNAARTHFKGLQSYPVNAGLRVEATYKPFPGGPKTVPHPNKVGLVEDEKCPGVVEFSFGGATHALEVIDEDGSDDEWFVIFKDLTSGTETYGMRYLYCAKKPAPGATTVTLDFNKAYNPPCSFTPYATCPLATKQNRLPFRVEAGEKMYDADGPATGLGTTAAAQAAQAAAKK